MPSFGGARFLTTTQIMRLYETHVTRAVPTQPSLLESAVSSPKNHFLYHGQDDFFRLAGILAERIILNHAYQDGNKRIALLAADMFLKVNGYQLQRRPFGRDAVNEGLKTAHVSVASREWSADDLAEYYRGIATPVGRVTAEIERFVADCEAGQEQG
jgi:death-on-curing family protein